MIWDRPEEIDINKILNDLQGVLQEGATGDPVLYKIFQALFVLVNKVNHIDNKVNELNTKIERVEGRLADIEDALTSIEGIVTDVRKQIDDIRSSVGHTSNMLGALTEATISRFLLEHLRSEGYSIRKYIRNYQLDGYDIDLLVDTVKDGERVVLVTSIKVKPKHKHVSEVLGAADLYEAKHKVNTVPVLAGVWIGSEIEAYARRKGVIIVKF